MQQIIVFIFICYCIKIWKNQEIKKNVKSAKIYISLFQENMENQKSLKKKTKYYCYDCDYVTCNNSDYNRHIFTRKHKINIGEIFEEVESTLQKKQYVYEFYE